MKEDLQKIFHLKAVFVGFPLIHGRVTSVQYVCNDRKTHAGGGAKGGQSIRGLSHYFLSSL